MPVIKKGSGFVIQGVKGMKPTTRARAAKQLRAIKANQARRRKKR